jgi:hypothetical protein
MKITQPVSAGGGWLKFDVNVGGFLIRGCTWHPGTGRLRFPRRRKWPRSDIWLGVVRAPKGFVARLKQLLASGQLEAKRDRSPRAFKIVYLKSIGGFWFTFGFQVRGVTIRGCRWSPEHGCIQFPITYRANDNCKKRVVHATGPHVIALREALKRYAIKEDLVSEALLAAFQEEIEERKMQRQLAKAA